ncbi:MAG: hypothetical protein LUQ07_02775 [Methanospirillum sp.]|nr:hypothetical protein [Methanospirillum sp.]
MKGFHGYLLLIILFILPASVLGTAPGDILHNQVFGLPGGPEWGYGLDSSPDGNITICGVAYPNQSLDIGELGNGDVWVIRIDKNLKMVWEHLFGGNETDYALSVRNLPDGGAALIGTTGSYNGDVTGYHGNGDMWFVNLDPQGNIRWERALGGNKTDEGSDFVVLPDGGFILCGYSMSQDGNLRRNLGGGDLWLMRLDTNGTMLWQQTYGGSKRDSGTSVIMTRDNGIVVCGNTNSTDGMVSGNRTSSDVWIIKTDINGTLLWEKAYGGSALDWGHSVIELTSGDLMVAAVTASGDGDVGVNHGAGDLWLIRLHPDGTRVWEKTYGGSFSDNVWKLEPSPSGGAYFVGDSYSVDGDFSGNHGESDLLVGEVDANGSLQWYRQVGGSFIDRGSWLKRTVNNTLVMTGMTTSSDGDLAETGDHTSGDLWLLEVQGGVPSALEPGTTDNVTSVSPESAPPAVLPGDNVTTVSPEVTATTVSAADTATTDNGTAVDNITAVSQEGNISVPVPEVPVSSTTEGNVTIGPLGGTGPVPTDPDGDGKYEDLNGNGKMDLQDPTSFFQNFSWLKDQGLIVAFDFNENGVLDLGDIQALLAEIQS